MAAVASSSWLVPLPGGPALEPLEIKADPSGITIGRHEGCDVRLPPEADKVSRQHARFSFDGAEWRLMDLKSRWGTYLNGVKIPPQREMPITQGDLVRIVPWTFNFSTSGVPKRGLQSVDDTSTAQTMIRSLSQEQAKPLHDEMLNLLLESASAIHAAEEETSLATVLMDIACRGTGLPNAAVLRPLDAGGRIEVVLARHGPHAENSGDHAGYSRSLLHTASQGVVAELSGGSGANISESIVQMRIDSAICAPLMVGSTIAAYLYLDSRGGLSGGPRPLRPNASGFCLALAKIAGLALSNLKRIDIEHRTALIEAELNAAAAAQKWILPRGETRSGPISCAGDSRAGQYLGGDFFDAIVLADGRMAVALGDVSGHGIAASVLMTATQGFLHAALAEHGDPARAVTELNRFVNPRRPANKFVTMWVGVFDPRNMSVTYVDAGHGYALLAKEDQTFDLLAGGDGVPVGILDDIVYSATTSKLPPGGRALIISDGIIEQTEADMQPGQTRRQFDLSGVQTAIAMAAPTDNAIEKLFEAVYQFSNTRNLSDDATAVLVKW